MRTNMFFRKLMLTLLITLFAPSFALALPGDLNGSGRVDGYDLIIFGRANGSTAGDSNWNPDADLDGNGVVNQADINILSTHFGNTGISFGLWVGDQKTGNQRVSKLSSTGNLLVRVGEFAYPRSISSNVNDNSIWVADSYDNKVVKLDSFNGQSLLNINGMDPYSVSVNVKDNSVWVADYNNNRVVKLLPSVTDGYTVGTDTGFEVVISGFNRPRSVSVDPERGVVWVADRNNNRVIRLSADISNGYDISSDTGKHLIKTGFSTPNDVSVNTSDGTVWVTDFGNNQVVKLSSSGLTELARVNGFNEPYSLDVNYIDGSVWIADKNNDRVVRLSPDGALLAENKGFSGPLSVSVNPLSGNCWAADSGNHQVVKLSPNGTELLRLNGFTSPASISVISDEFSTSKSPWAVTSTSLINANIGENIDFNGTGADPDGSIVLYEWDFDGDGVFDYSSSQTGVTTHDYTAAGTYNPVFRVTDNQRLTATDYSLIIRVGKLKAAASADITSGSAPLTVNFKADFTDPTDGFIDSYQWDFDGDGIFEYYSETSGSTNYVFSKPGTYLSTLKIIDGPFTAVDTITINVFLSSPSAEANGSPSSGLPPLTVEFTGTGTDPDGSIVLYEWDFDGDGNYDWHSSSGGNTNHIYTISGYYTAKFRVTDNDGIFATKDIPIEVGTTPVAVANANPVKGYPPLAVSFDATGSTDLNGSISTYEWDFGECLFYDSMENNTTGWTADAPWARTNSNYYSRNTSWTDSPGEDYASNTDVSLTSPVIDLSGVSSATLSFRHRYRTQENYDKCHVEISTNGTDWTEIAVYSGTLENWSQVQIDISQYLPSSTFYTRFRLISGSSVNYDGWYIDDVAVCVQNWETSSDGTAAHTYNNDGIYTATLRVTDNDQIKSTDTVNIKVIPDILPVALAGADSNTGFSPLTVNFTGSGQDPDSGDSIAGYKWNFGEEYIWVADSSNNRVVRLAPDGSILGTATGFNNPYFTAVNPADGTVWVANFSGNSVKRLGANGVLLTSVSDISQPRSIAVNPDQTVWVAASGSDKLIKIAPDGKILATINGIDAYSVAVNPNDGTVWAADSYNKRVVKLPALIPDGYTIGTDTGYDTLIAGFNHPKSISLNKTDGSVWVADSDNNQVVKLDGDGNELLRISGFYTPLAVSVDSSDGSVWVADYNNNRIVKLLSSITDGYTVGTDTGYDNIITGFYNPISVAVNSSSAGVWVADSGNNQVVKLDTDGNERLRVSGFNHPGALSAVDTGTGNYYSSSSSGDTNHTYAVPGIYPAVLTVTDGDGNTDTRTVEIRVYGKPSVTAESDINTGPAPLEVFFAGSTDDLDGSVVKYEWDFDGDGIYDWASENNANARHVYSAADSYNAVLRITDNDHYSNTDSVTITVNQSPPLAAASADPLRGNVSLTVNFAGSGTDPDGAISLYEWDFDGDGTYDYSSGTTGDTSHQYDIQGTYTSTFKVTDNDGLTDTTDVKITVKAAGEPFADITATPIDGTAPLNVQFQGVATDNGTIVTYEWDFDGDGTWDDSSSGDTVNHIYENQGVYSPVLRITDNDSNQETATTTIDVKDSRNVPSVWVADYNSNRIIRRSKDGEELVKTDGFNRPRSVTVNQNTGNAWVADTENDRVIKLSGNVPDGYSLSVSKITTDSSTTGNAGFLYGDTLPGTGTLNGDMGFDGNGDYILIPSNSAMDVNDFTFEAWIKPATTGRTVFMRGNTAGGDELWIYLYNNNTIRVYLQDTYKSFSGSATFNDGNWHHLAVVYDSTAGELTCYVDGSSYGSMASIGKTLDFGKSHALIGAHFSNYNNNPGSYFNGGIDDVRLWNVARSAAEISNNKDSELAGTETGLVGYWKLNSTADTPYHQTFTGFDNPYDIDLDKTDDSVWVADYNNNKVVKLSHTGTRLTTISGFNRPQAVNVDSQRDVVWVADTNNDRVIRFPVNIPDEFVADATYFTPDAAGSHNGMLFGDAFSETGHLNNGLSLDGNGDYVQIHGSSSLDVQNFTLEAWINTTTAGNYGTIFMRGNASGGDDLRLSLYNSTTVWTMVHNTQVSFTGSAITDGQWHHIALVYDSAQLRCYVDGTAYGSPATLDKTLDFGGSDALVGADFDSFNASLGNYFNGKIDDLRLWNVARSETEINNNKDTQLAGTETGLVGYWKLDSTTDTGSKIVSGFNNPVSLSVDSSDGSVWVTDYYNHQAARLDKDGIEIERANGFNYPAGIFANSSDQTAWIMDKNNNQVVKLSPDASEIIRLDGFNQPQGADVNPLDGSIWVADYGNNEIVEMAANGTELQRITGFYNPIDISIDRAERKLNNPPLASASVSPESGTPPLDVTFTGSATDDGTIERYRWDFDGNGIWDYDSTVTGNTTHTYEQPGTYNPVFAVTDNDGFIDYNSEKTVIVGPMTVYASASPLTGNAPVYIDLNGSVKGMATGRKIVLYEWDYDGDGVYDASSAASPKIRYKYWTGNIYVATLRVTDDAGNEAMGSVIVTINQIPPSVNNNASPVSGFLPLHVNLSSYSSDTDGSIVRYEWDYDGDGAYDWFSDSTGNTVFTYTQAGTYNTTVKVTDNDGLTATAGKVITVNERQDPPRADVSADITGGNVPLTVNFTGTGNDPDDGTITLYEWDFDGDGTYDESSTVTGNASHAYNAPGIFSATLRVTDADGLTDTAGLLITAKTAGTPTAAGSADLTQGAVPLIAGFNASGSSDTDGNIVKYEWIFGDETLWVADKTDIYKLKGFQKDVNVTGLGNNNNNRVAINSSTGSVWVSDFNNDRVLKLNSKGGEESSVTGFDGPMGLSVNQTDNSIWVADYNNNKVVKLSDDGTQLLQIIGFNKPKDVKVDSNRGIVWAADTSNDRVIRFPVDVPDGFVADATYFTPDAAGSHNGMLLGDALSTTGHLNNGLNLDGNGDYIQIHGDASLDVQNFTLEAWINTTTAGSYGTIFMRGNVSGGDELRLSLYNSTTVWTMVHNTQVSFTGSAITDGQWHHIALVYDSAQLRCYVDGTAYGTPVAMVKTLDFGGSDALVGADFDSFNASLGNYFNGKIDDLRLWNVTRSETEINSDKDTQLTGTETGLVGYWKLDSTTATGSAIVGGFNDPVSLSVDPSDGSVWVVDYYNHRVAKLDAEGTLLVQSDDFTTPVHVEVDPNDHTVWVTDGGTADQVVKLTPDADRKLVTISDLNNPNQVYVNSDSTIWIADSSNDRILKATAEGRIIRTVKGFNDPLSLVAFNDSSNSFSSTVNGNATYAYSSGGEYIATLKVTDNDGATDMHTVSIKAGSFPESRPMAYPVSGPAPLDVVFSSNGISETSSLDLFEWDFDGDGQFDSTTTISKNFSHTYQSPGTYVVTQKVTDSRGLTDTGTITITVTLPDGSPVAEIAANTVEGLSPLEVHFSGFGKDKDGYITKFEWDFDGDGQFDESSATGGETVHTYGAQGLYVAKLRVTDNDGLIATDTLRIEVKPVGAPTAIADADKTDGTTSFDVNFMGNGTDEDGNIVKYEWDFDGDGTYDFSSMSSAQTSFHYAQSGSYDAILRVTDNNGLTDTDVVKISVAPGISASLDNDAFDPTMGETVHINSVLTENTTVTINIFDKAGNLIRTLVSSVPRTAGYYSDAWDGKNQTGQPVDDGVYLYTIEYVVGGKAYLYDVTGDFDPGHPHPDPYMPDLIYPDNFDPFIPEKNFFRYTLETKSEVTVYMSFFGGEYEFSGPRVRTLLFRAPRKAGSYAMVWDGLDDLKNLVRPHQFVIGLFAWELPQNAIIVATKPVISDLNVTPSYFNPSPNPYSVDTPGATFSYSLSKASDLSATIYNATNYVVRTETITGVTAGNGKQFMWDGKNNNGDFVSPGTYRLKLIATDVNGTSSSETSALLTVFY